MQGMLCTAGVPNVGPSFLTSTTSWRGEEMMLFSTAGALVVVTVFGVWPIRPSVTKLIML